MNSSTHGDDRDSPERTTTPENVWSESTVVVVDHHPGVKTMTPMVALHGPIGKKKRSKIEREKEKEDPSFGSIGGRSPGHAPPKDSMGVTHHPCGRFVQPTVVATSEETLFVDDNLEHPGEQKYYGNGRRERRRTATATGFTENEEDSPGPSTIDRDPSYDPSFPFDQHKDSLKHNDRSIDRRGMPNDEAKEDRTSAPTPTGTRAGFNAILLNQGFGPHPSLDRDIGSPIDGRRRRTRIDLV